MSPLPTCILMFPPIISLLFLMEYSLHSNLFMCSYKLFSSNWILYTN